jgi:thioredoxin 1
LWIDADRDFSVVRCERRELNLPPLDVAIDVKRGPSGEWLPAKWAFQILQDRGGRPASLEATVTVSTINEKLTEQTFAAVAPSGDQVFDLTVDAPIRDWNDPSGWLPESEARKTLDAIANAWLHRQLQFETCKFASEREGRAGTSLPLTKTVMSLDREKIALEVTTPSLQPHPGNRRKSNVVCREKTVFDGVITQSLTFDEQTGALSNLFTGVTDYYCNHFREPQWMFVIRPLDKNVGRIPEAELRDPSVYRVRAGRAKIGEAACVIIETEQSPGWRESYWLDPDRDYLPLRKHMMMNGKDSNRLDWTYRQDPTHGWIPVGWKDYFLGQDGAGSCDSSTVTSYAINGPVPASEFRLVPPGDAKVQDFREGTPEGTRFAEVVAQNEASMKKWKIRAREEARRPKQEPKCIFDAFADASADVQTAINEAKQSHKHVLIVFGANSRSTTCALGLLLRQNADLAAAVKKAFVLVLVDADFETGKKMSAKYVPRLKRHNPQLVVLDASQTVLTSEDVFDLFDSSDERRLRTGNDYDLAKINEFLDRWSH